MSLLSVKYLQSHVLRMEVGKKGMEIKKLVLQMENPITPGSCQFSYNPPKL